MLAGLSLSMLMPSLDTSIANVGLPSLAEAFGASFQQVQWIVLAYLLAITTLIVSAGRLGDLVGRRRLLLLGIGLFTAASLLCGLAPTLSLLIAARAAQGVGAAIMMALTMALVGDTVPKARVGSAMGLLGTMSAIGTTFGPSLGGALIAGFGWRMIFLINVPLGILNFVLALRTLPVDRRKGTVGRGDIDVVGTFMLALTLAAYALAMTIGRGFGMQNITLLSLAAAGTLVFAFIELRASSPLLPLAMFRDPMLSTALAVSALVSTAMMATLVVGPFYLSRALGLDAVRVGLVMSVGPLVAALTGTVAGRAVDRAGSRRVATVGLSGMSVGLIALAIAPGYFGVRGYLAAVVVVTAHYALLQTANNTAVMAGAGHDQRGVIAGMLGLSRNLGLISGASAMGAIFAFASSADNVATALPASIAVGMRATYLIAASLTGAALVALAIANFASHTGRHDSRVGHHGSEGRSVRHHGARARRSRDEALQPEVAPRPGLAAEVDGAPA